MSLQHLLQEQKKEARECFEKDLIELKSTGDAVVDRALLLTLIDQIVTTAITKTWELALEEVEKEAQKGYDIHLQIENTHETYPKDWHEGNRNALADILTHIAHIKETK